MDVQSSCDYAGNGHSLCAHTHPRREDCTKAEGGGKQCFSEWRFVNVLLSAAIISVAISVRNGGAFTRLMSDAGGKGGEVGTGVWAVIG